MEANQVNAPQVVASGPTGESKSVPQAVAKRMSAVFELSMTRFADSHYITFFLAGGI
jgi:hypothetical protein